MRQASHPKIILLSLFVLFLHSLGVSAQKKSFAEISLAKCWSYSLGNRQGEQIMSDGNLVFIGSHGANIEALSLDGKKVWFSEFGGGMRSNLLASDNGIFLVTSTSSGDAIKAGDSKLRLLSKETGIMNWSLPLPDAERHFLESYDGSVIVVSSSGPIQSIDSRNGTVKWRREIADGFVTKPIFTATNLIAAATGNRIFILSMATGEIEKMRQVGFSVTALGVAAIDRLIVGDERGNVYFFNGGEKSARPFKAGGKISDVIARGDEILVASHDNYVYLLRNRNGSRQWKIRLASRASHVAIYADSYVVVSTSFYEHRAILVELKSGRVAVQILFDEDETAIDIRSYAGTLYVLTNLALHAYRLNDCSNK